MISKTEKTYKGSKYDLIECPQCYGSGIDPSQMFTRVDCHKCDGNGKMLIEAKRSVESAVKNVDEDDDSRLKDWLFAD